MLRSHLPKGTELRVSYENTRWTIGGIVFCNVEIEGSTKEAKRGFTGKIDEFQLGWFINKSGLRFYFHLQHPKIELFGKMAPQAKEEKLLYPAFDRFLFKTPVTIEEGELSLKEDASTKGFFTLEEKELEEKRFSFAFQRGKEKSSPILGKFTKDKNKGALIFHWAFSEIEAASLFQIIPSISSYTHLDWQVKRGWISGNLSFALFPKDQVKDLCHHLDLFDFSLFHSTYLALLTLNHLQWKGGPKIGPEAQEQDSHLLSTLLWPYFVGEGKLSGAQLRFLKEDQKEVLATFDLWGDAHFNKLNKPTLLLNGMLQLNGRNYPLELIGEGLLTGDDSFKVVFDLNLLDGEGKKTNAYIACASQEKKKKLVRGDLTGFNLDQTRFLTHLLKVPFPQLQHLEIEGGSFDTSLIAWLGEKKLLRLEVSRFIGRNATFSFPTRGVSCDTAQMEVRGEFDFTSKDAFDGSRLEVKLSSSLCFLSPEVKIEELEAELSMHEDYIKPSWVRGKIGGVKGKIFLEGFYHNLNVSLGFPIEVRKIGSAFFPQLAEMKNFSNSTVATEWAGTVRLFEGKSCIEGNLCLTGERGEKDTAFFGVLFDPKKLTNSFLSLSSLYTSLSEGWFSARKLSHHTLNLFLASWEDNWKGEGNIDVEATFDKEKITFYLGSSHFVFHSPSLTFVFPEESSPKELSSFLLYDFQKKLWKGNLYIETVILSKARIYL